MNDVRIRCSRGVTSRRISLAGDRPAMAPPLNGLGSLNYDLRMIRLGRGSLSCFALWVQLASALVVLAALEYRWAGIVSEANRERCSSRYIVRFRVYVPS